jgi:small-conductance mechanosensitive channel
MRQLAWPAFAFGIATLIALLFRAVLLSVIRRWASATGGWSSLAQAIRVPSILWSIVLGIWIGNEVARQTESLPQRLSQQVGVVLEVAVILSVTITVSNALTLLVLGASERRALGGPITGLGQAVVRGIVYIIGCLVLLGALGIQITPILTALGVGGLAVGSRCKTRSPIFSPAST